MISDRTKAALKAARERGTNRKGDPLNLGGDRGYRDGKPPSHLGAAAVRQQADQAAHRVLDAINAAKATQAAAMSLQKVADALTAQGVATPRGGVWTATAVRRVLARAV
jgi:hypothetical protein